MFKTIGRAIYDHPFLSLTLFALTLRLLFLILMLNQLHGEELVTILTDVSNYVGTARGFLDTGTLDPRYVNIFGPGYPFFLIGISALFGWNTISALVIQCLISALCAGGIFLFTRDLLGDRRIAFAAGFLFAISPVSISLANILLSETVFVSALLAGCLLFQRGIKKGAFLPYLFAGLCFSVATLTRAQGLLLPLVLLIWVLLFRTPLADCAQSRRRMLRGAILMLLMAAALSGGWMLRNMVVDEMPHVSRAIPGGFAKVGVQLAAELDRLSWEEEKQRFDSLLALETEGRTPAEYYRIYSDFAIEFFFQSFRRAPFTASMRLIKIGIANIHSEEGLTFLQLPRWKDELSRLSTWMKKKGLQYRVSLFALVGLILLWRRRLRAEAMLLLFIYGYISGTSFFTLWQGDRIMYPAIVAWSPLIAAALVGLYDLIRGMVQGRGRRIARTIPDRHGTDHPHA